MLYWTLLQQGSIASGFWMTSLVCKWWIWELMLATNFGSPLQMVTKVASQILATEFVLYQTDKTVTKWLKNQRNLKENSNSNSLISTVPADGTAPLVMTKFESSIYICIYICIYIWDHHLKGCIDFISITGTSQATGLDAWASRVKYPARFVSHLHDICIYMSCL